MEKDDIIEKIKNQKIEKVINLFNNQNKEIQNQILKELSNLKKESLILFWTALIKSNNRKAQDQLTNILINLNDIEKNLSPLINHENKNIRRKAVFVLGKKLTKGKIKDPEPLIKALNHNDLGIKKRAMVAIAKARVKEALPTLAHLLEESFGDVQKKVIKTISQIGGEKAKEILIDNKDSIDSENKNILIKYLSSLGYNLRKDINKKIINKLESNLKINNYRYLGLTVKGLEEQAISSIKQKLNIKVLKISKGKIIFEYKGDIRDLKTIRSLKDVYLLITSFDPKEIKQPSLKDKLNQIDISFLTDLFKKEDKFAFFVNLRKIKNNKIKPILGNILKDYFKKHGFITVSNEYNLEIKVFPTKNNFLLGLKLVDFLEYNRKWRKNLSSTALKPYIAHLLCLLSKPQKTDIFLDPMCGSGSILIERALMGKYQRIIGSDIDEKALKAAKNNIKQINKKIELHNWNAFKLPLEDNSINKIVVDMPFGIRSGKHSQNITLYSNFLKEAKRVLKPNSIVVILSQEISLLDKQINKTNNLTIRQKIRTNLGGLKPAVFVLSYNN